MKIEKIQTADGSGRMHSGWEMIRASDTELVTKLDIDDYYYRYTVYLNGTKEEMDAVEQFCWSINEHKNEDHNEI